MDPDSRYARGEITRDEWQRLRSAPPPAQSPPKRAPSRSNLLLIAVLLVAGVLVATAFLLTLRPPASQGWTPTLGTPTQLHSADLATLNASATVGTAYAGNNTLWFPAGDVKLVVYASPPAHDMAFVIQGMADPTVHVAAGSRVTVTVVNMDSDVYHNWGLTAQAPPYSTMPMMGSGMVMSMTMLAPMSTSGYWSQDLSFTAVAGTYWYLCSVMNHASQGMYGGFDVA